MSYGGLPFDYVKDHISEEVMKARTRSRVRSHFIAKTEPVASSSYNLIGKASEQFLFEENSSQSLSVK